MQEPQACSGGCQVNARGVDDECSGAPSQSDVGSGQCEDADPTFGWCGNDDTLCCSGQCVNSYCASSGTSTTTGPTDANSESDTDGW
jgi:hypothetical protein